MKHGNRLAAAVGIWLTWLASMPAVAGSWSELMVARMQVELFIPDGPPQSAAGRPLMVSLHGCLQTGDHLRERGNWAATAEAFGMVVALPTVPDGGKVAGCWDYYGQPSPVAPVTPPHSRQNRDNDNLLALVDDLLADPTLGIDPSQVYLSGLSSGGGQTFVLGCLAPDVFAGIGIVAGPALGTAANEINPVTLPVNRAEVTSACRALAGANADDLATQVTSVAFGSIDFTVSQAYSALNGKVMADVYGAAPSGSFDLSGQPGFQPQGQGSLWADADGPRVSLVRIDGMGHAWPAGSGPGGEQNFIASRGLSYPAYLTAFLTSNNRRLAAPAPPPQLTAEVVVDDEAATIEIRGEAGVDDGALDEITVELAGLSDPAFRLGPVEVEQPSPPAFSWTSDPLPASASYRATVRARADEAEAVAEMLFGIGLDAPFPPVLGEVVSSVDQGCLTMFGPVRDDNGDLDRVTVAIDGGPARDALLNAARDSWTLAELCTLEPGQHAVVVTAFDLAGLEGQPVQLDVEIPVPFVTVTDTLGGHVAAQRIRFYFEAGHFGSVDVPFTTLLMEHGSLTPFPLYGINDRFFAVRPGTAIAGGPISAIAPAAGARSEITLPASAALAEALNALMASGLEVSITISPPRGR